MAINLDFSNDAIAAYSRGAQERALQEERLRDAADKQVELKQRQQQLDQTAKFEQQRIDNEHDFHDKTIELSRAASKLALNDSINRAQLQQSETGQTPAGFNPVYIPNAQDPTKSDVQQYVDPTNPAARFQPIDPAVMAQRTQQQLEPKTNETIRQQKALQDAEQVKALAVAVQHGVDQERIRREQIEEQTKLATMNNASREKVAGIRAAATHQAGTSAKEATLATGIAQHFEGDKQIQEATQLAENVADVSRIDIHSNNPNVDQKLIFGAGRLVNPAIGVRGYEYNALRDNAQSIADTVGIKLSNFFDKHESLTPEARQKLKDFILENSQGKFDAADAARANYLQRLKTIAPSIKDADAFLGPSPHTVLLNGTGYKRQDSSKNTSNIPEVTTKAQFDALPKGAKYTENGHPFIKP